MVTTGRTPMTTIAYLNMFCRESFFDRRKNKTVTIKRKKEEQEKKKKKKKQRTIY